MSATTHTDSIERNAADVYRAILDSTTDDVLAVGLPRSSLEELIEVLTEQTAPPRVRLLAEESVLKALVEGFTTASRTADLVAADVLSLRSSEERLDGPLLFTDDAVVSVVSTTNLTAGLSTRDEEFVEVAGRCYADRWDDAEPFKLRTPALSRVRESLGEEFGPELQSDFEQMRVALGSARGEDTDVDEVVVSLLAAAKNEALLYDISTWGEDVGVASRATFSRKKTHLEERGLIDTEKVPIDVGRPRLRLRLGDERLQRADAEELVSVAQSMLSAGA